MCRLALITRGMSATCCGQEAESRCTPSVAYAAAYYRGRYSAVNLGSGCGALLPVAALSLHGTLPAVDT
jgi:hypothetical protein